MISASALSFYDLLKGFLLSEEMPMIKLLANSGVGKCIFACEISLQDLLRGTIYSMIISTPRFLAVPII